MEMIDVLTLNYNDSSTTINFVKSVESYRCVGRILVVDNCSTDDSLNLLKKLESDRVLVISNDKNGGYGAGNNLGIRYLYNNLRSNFILLANPDVVVEESVLECVCTFLKENDDYAIAAPVMTDLNGKIQYNTAFKIPTLWSFLMSFELLLSKTFKPFKYEDAILERKPFVDVCAVSGSMFMMNVEKMVKYGMFDENVFLYCEEHILGVKLAKAGVKTALLTSLRFIHNHSVSIGKSYKSIFSRNKILNASRIYVLKKYYNANSVVLFIARILSKVNLLESFLVDVIKRWI
jgi:GT2 family glycosyltransferase